MSPTATNLTTVLGELGVSPDDLSTESYTDRVAARRMVL